MSLSVLNNIPSLVAQNNLTVTNNNLQNTLFQLSSGSRINSGADDPAGLSIVNGLQANISALSQSAQNVTDGVGQLQVADGALSQVTTLLNRAVTLATEAANGGLTSAQFSAITNEFGSITSEINRIGQATNFNGTQVFSSGTSANANQVATTADSAVNTSTLLTAGQTTSVGLGNGSTYTYTAGGANASVVASSVGGLTSASPLTDGQTMTIGNGTNNYTFTADAPTYTGGQATAGATATGANDGLTVVNGAGQTTTYNMVAVSTVGAWLTAFNAAGAANGVSAALNGTGNLVISSTTGISSVSGASASNIADFGALTKNAETVGNLISQINSSLGNFSASVVGGNLNITSSAGKMSLAAGSTMLGGSLTATNTVQDLINGVNASGSGLTAGLATVKNTNTVVSTGSAAGNLTDGLTFTINSGPSVNGVYQNTYTYTSTAGTTGTIADPVAGTQGNDSVQGLIDSINNSGTPFHASLDANGKMEITDSSYSGNLSVTDNLTTNGGTAPGTFASPGGSSGIQQLEITDPTNRGSLSVQSNDPALGFVATPNGSNGVANPLKGGNADAFAKTASTGGGSAANVFVSDGQVTGALNNTISVAIGALSSSQIGTNATALQTQNLGTAAGAGSALTVINSAISNVAAMRGTIGAGINRLNSATNVINTQIQNLTSAQSSMQDANIGQVVANMSKYQVLEQTGISALAQSNQNEQAVLKLLQ